MMTPVADASVRRAIKTLYIGSGFLFGANIAVGILNAFTDGEIPHAQILTHFHAGTIGWVTLSVIATALWVFTGQREVSKGYGTFVRVLSWIGILAVLGYIFAFALAFGEQGDYWQLLPIFGVPTGLVILAAFVFLATQFKHQDVITTPHVLLFGALLVASLGALMGITWGLTYAADFDPYPDNDAVDGIGAHAGPMDMYLALAFGAFVELMVLQGGVRRTKPGITQATLGIVSAFAVSVGLFMGIEPLAPVALLLFLAAFGFYMVRAGWRTFKVNPATRGTAPGLFFGGLFFPIYVLLFVFLVFQYFIPGDDPPHALEVLFVHVTFVGVGTNLLFTMQAQYAPDASTDTLLSVGLWTTNVGLVAFIVGEYVAETPHGALVMALGVLICLFTVWRRLLYMEQAPPVEPSPPVDG